MEKFFVLLLFLLLGGCLAAPPEPPPVAPVAQKPQVELEPLPSLQIQPRPGFSVLAEAVPASAPAEPEPPRISPETLDKLHLAEAEAREADHDGLTLLTDEVILDFPVVKNEQVHYFIDYYTGEGRAIFTRLLERADRYIPYMRKIFKEEGLPEGLTYLALVESGFNPQAYSRADASGLWQFIESTGHLYGLSNDWWRDERRDFEKSTRAAARFLNDLHERFEGDWYLAVAAYNAGGGTISRAVAADETSDFWELTEGSSIRTETKNYLPKLLAALTIANNPERYGFTDLAEMGPLRYDVVRVAEITDLELVAQLCEVSRDEIKYLNPELKRGCTPPGEEVYQLRIPPGKKTLFEERYAEIPADRRASFRRHRVAKGETLGKIARRYHVHKADLVAMNNLENTSRLRAGEELLLPVNPGADHSAEEPAVAAAPARGQNYKVRGGDTLWAIAKRFAVSEQELRSWNQLDAKSVLRAGQTLVVAAAESRPAAKSGTKTAKATRGAERKIVYQVKSGDTLAAIGRKYAVATDQIKDWNKLAEDHILRPGDQLTLLVSDGKRS